MKISIMQPYFLPYIGYWQLMVNADIFVVYDSVEYTKKGWINRNRYCNGEYFTIPLKKSADNLHISDKYISEGWQKERERVLRKVHHFYKKCPMFDDVYPMVERLLLNEERNLFVFIYNSFYEIIDYLDIKTPVLVTSDFEEGSFKNKERVKNLCKTLAEDNIIYVNPIGGTGLYDYEEFKRDGIELRFLKSKTTEYLSILDLIFRYDKQELKNMLYDYKELKDGVWAI